MKPALSFAAALALGASAAVALLPAPPAEAVTPALCPERLVSGMTSIGCLCSSEATATGGVWGSDVYTDDSAICRAALHAGVIGTNGGLVWVREERGRDSYPAVTRNSVASSSWGQWGRSIAFRTTYEDGDAAKTVQACPGSAGGLAVGATLTCGCPAEATTGGAVWGAGPYTGDSAICRAALHAGAVGSGGGEVTIRVSEGRSSYPASSRNGVNASSWGSFSSSFSFER